MDAHAILTAQGWRGTGHTLHPTSDSNGLTHHLLIKREGTDGRGLGSRKDHKAEAWWMNAFDQALKGIDVSNKGGLKQTAVGGKLALDKITARGAGKYTGSRGLYHSFVKGGTLSGTVCEWKEKQKASAEAGLMTPPESGVGTPSEIKTKESQEERRARKSLKKAAKAAQLEAEAKAAQLEAEAKAARKVAKKTAKEAVKATETKEERRLRRDARRARKEDKRRTKVEKNG
jgi:nucleolar protein TMA23